MPVAWNLSVSENVQHDSSTGWSDIVTPGLSLRPNRHLSLDANIPWYPSLAAYTTTVVNATTTTVLTQQHNVLGDITVSAHAGGNRGDFGFNAGAAVGLPTGHRSLGVGAGSTTYHIGGHAEYSIGPFTPDIEAGLGNSSAFATHLVRKAYTAVGEIANFQLGMNVDLPARISFDAQVYEAMPLQTATITGTIARRGTHGRGTGRHTVQSAAGSAEDNGISLELERPITRNLALTTGYDRSFIQADDIVSIGVTWLLRTPRKREAAPASPLSRRGH